MALAKVDEKGLAHQLLEAKTVRDVDEILRQAVALYGPLEQHPVGDRPNNIGAVRAGSDPALGVVERVVNAMDALLDLGRAQHPNDDPKSPREAAQMWFGVPNGGLAEMPDDSRRQLGGRIRVWLDESGDPKRPTVVVEDRGIGQAPARFPGTLVSLNEENKVRQSWNMGTYGQGGAVAFGFSEATIIISRRHPDFRDGAADRVGWTVVRRFDDPTGRSLPNYRYVVDKAGRIPQLDPSLFPDFAHGTRIIHVGYDLQGWTGPFTTGLWQFLHAALFDPVLPFLLTGKRKKESNYGTRIIIGNAARLKRPERARGDLDVAHHDSFDLDLGKRYGAVTFNYWVLTRPPQSDNSTDPAASYVRADSAISMTLFGQRQDTLARSWINNIAKLPFLYKSMVVQVSTDGFTPVAKNDLFTSTRERATKSDLLSKIYGHLASVLKNDEALKRLDHEQRERQLAKSTGASSEKVRKRLAKYVTTKLHDLTKPGGGGLGTGKNGRRQWQPGPPSPPRDTTDTHLPNVPTHLRFQRDVVRVHQGAGGYTWVDINAKNGYLPAHNDSLEFAWTGKDPGEHVRLTMRSQLLGGWSRWLFEADNGAEVGDYEFEATLYTTSGILSDSVTIRVAAPPPGPNQTKGSEPETGPEIRWVKEADWPDHDMDARTVGYVSEDTEKTIIWLSLDYPPLKKALTSGNRTEQAMENLKERYEYPIACALWLQDYQLKNEKPPPSEKYRKTEQQRLAEAVLNALEPEVDVAVEESDS